MENENEEIESGSHVNRKIKEFEKRIAKLRNEEKKQHSLMLSRKGGSVDDLLLSNISSQTTIKSEVVQTKADLKECWICLSDDTEEIFIRPCKCKGSTKYVHRRCFLDFLESKGTGTIKCSFCKMKYKIRSKYNHIIACYDFLKKANFYASNVIFMASLMILVYLIIFAYGITLFYIFLGGDAFKDYVYNYSNNCFEVQITNSVRIAIGIPFIPICLLLSNHGQFSYSFHIIPCAIMLDQLSIRQIFYSILPILFIVYNKIIRFAKRRLGYHHRNNGGIMVNEHQFEIKIITNSLLFPFMGVLLGNLLFHQTKMTQCDKSLYGNVIFILSKDILAIYYLILIKRRARNLLLDEYDSNAE